jgi:hypothetical protein
LIGPSAGGGGWTGTGATGALVVTVGWVLLTVIGSVVDSVRFDDMAAP